MEGGDDLTQEVETGHRVLAAIEAQHPEPGTVIARRVLVGLGSGDLDDFDVHLGRLTGSGLFEELSWRAARRRLGRCRGGKPRASQMREIVLVATEPWWPRRSQIRVRHAPYCRSRRAWAMRSTTSAAIRRRRRWG